MSDRNSCRIWLAIILALVFAAVPLLLMEINGFTYETNDDFVIAGIISKGEGWVPYVSKLLTVPLQGIDTEVNVWTVFNIAAIAAGAALMAYVLCRSSEIWWLMSLIPLCVSVFGIFCREINYTKTAICLFTGGASMLIMSLFGEDNPKGERIAAYVLGAVAVVVSAMIREASALMGLVFLFFFTAAMLIVNIRRLDFVNDWPLLLKKGIMMLVAAALCLGTVGISHLLYTKEEREYARFNKARTAVVDYSFNYPQYGEASDEYDRRGISEADTYLMENWNYSDTELITTEKYKAMGELKHPTAFSVREFLGMFKRIAESGSYTLPLLLVLLLFFVKDSDNSVIPAAAGIVSLALVYLCLYLSGRAIDRVTDTAFYTAAILAIVCTVVLRSAWELERAPSKIIAGAAAAALIGSILCCPYVERILPDIGKQNLERREYAYLGEQSDKVFAMFIDGSDSYAVDPWAEMNINDQDNVIVMGGWTCRLPRWYEKIHALGIDNPYRALFERDDVYAVYDRITHRFINEHYGDISASEVFRLPDEAQGKGEHFVRYIKAFPAGKALEAHVDSFSEPETTFDFGRRWHIEGRVNAEPGEIYCNIKCGEKELSFAVTVDEKQRFTGTFYDIPENFDYKTAEFCFFK